MLVASALSESNSDRASDGGANDVTDGSPRNPLGSLGGPPPFFLLLSLPSLLLLLPMVLIVTTLLLTTLIF